MMLEQICRDLVNSRHPPVLKLHKFKQVHDKKNHPCDFVAKNCAYMVLQYLMRSIQDN